MVRRLWQVMPVNGFRMGGSGARVRSGVRARRVFRHRERCPFPVFLDAAGFGSNYPL